MDATEPQLVRATARHARRICKTQKQCMTDSDLAWCAELAEKTRLPRVWMEESLALLMGDRLLLENVLTTAARAEVSPLAVIESILERRG